ncbi:MAG: Uma2 family endonuclease [Caldilineaceae bacterium]
MTQARAATAPTATVASKQQAKPIPAKKYRLADVSAFPTENGYRYEIIDGELIVTPAPARSHGIIASRIAYAMTGFFKQQMPEWSLIAQPISLEWETEDTAYHCEPDISIFDRPFEAVLEETDLFPAIVIEIVSPGNPENDYVRKVTAYAAIGIPEYWIVDSRHRTITFLALTTTGQQRHYAKIEHSQLLPETELALDEIFAGL